MKNYSSVSANFLKERIREIKDLLAFQKDRGNSTAVYEMEGDLKKLNEALKEKENKMKIIEVKLEFNGEKFVAVGEGGKIYYTAKKKADLKTSIKRSKKYQLTIVEIFTVAKPKPKAKKDTKKKVTKKSNSYKDRKIFIIGHFSDTELHSKSEKIAGFCKKFDLALTKAGRNLTFEKTLEKMVEEGVIEYLPAKEGAKYKKLAFQYTNTHSKVMAPDEGEL